MQDNQESQSTEKKPEIRLSIPSRPQKELQHRSQSLRFYAEKAQQQPLPSPPAPSFRPFLPSKPVEQLRTQKEIVAVEVPPEGISRQEDGTGDISKAKTLPVISQMGESSPPRTPGIELLTALKENRFSESVEPYAAWLLKRAARTPRQRDLAEKDLYIQESTKITCFQGQKINIFAPFRKEYSALQTFTRKQLICFFFIGICWLVGLYFFHLTMVTLLVGMITGIYTLCLIINTLLATRSFRKPVEESFDDELVDALRSAPWPKYTILCPLYKEATIVPQFVEAMQRLDYPAGQLQILLLTEESDRETRKAIRALRLPRQFEIVVVPDGQPRTKPRACNYGLLRATGEYVVIYDAEDIPEPRQLKKAILSFANNTVDTVCVQAKLNFYNSRQNLLTRWFAAEYNTWFGFILPALQLAGFVLPLGGTSNHFRTAALRALGGWDAYNVTEDCDLGLRLKRFNMQTVILNSTTLEEANPNLKNWLRQRSRWIKGYMQTYLIHMRSPLKAIRQGKARDFLSFQVVIGSGTGVLFFNPLMWSLLAIYMIKGSAIIEFYHLLFPGPILYLGLFCLVFGNFFYVYLYLLACTRRKDYALVFWSLFIPIYWLLMSVAGIYAFFELLIRPHYWQKTVHGFHIKGGQEQLTQNSTPAVDEHTQTEIPVFAQTTGNALVRSITSTLKSIVTLPLPAQSPAQKQATSISQQAKIRNIGLLLSMSIAVIAGLSALFYYYFHHQILLYADAHSHLDVARRFFDSTNPYDITQLGAVWLPLPHVLMWPFVWNDFLWRSGLAGSLVAFPCYLLTCFFIYKASFLLTREKVASLIGTLVFALNPSVLYIQTTPLSEMVSTATFVGACYFFLCFIQEDKTRYLVSAAFFTFLATLTRYDGWAMFPSLLLGTICLGIWRKNTFNKIVGHTIVYGALGVLGIVLWLIWSAIIFGNPLYFSNGPYSARSQQLEFQRSGTLFDYHNLPLSFQAYSVDIAQVLGPIILAFAVIGLLFFFRKFLFKKEILFCLLLLVPFVFYIYSLYLGQIIIYVPTLEPKTALSELFNVRYGIAMGPSCAIFASIFFALFKTTAIKKLFRLLLFSLLICQIFITAIGGNVVLQDGTFGISCNVANQASIFLAEHYAGGKVLENDYASRVNGDITGLDFKNVIYEGSGQIWKDALAHPEKYATWIMAYPSKSNDLVSRNIPLESPLFLAHFELVVQQEGGISLYHLRSDHLQKVRSISADFLSTYAACAKKEYKF